ncbi:hypothetical protein CYLTODRAFT_415370 [Cylindrobasidium torrendii FP15055 ss-10]|uniref:Uncharacterized protein n=1 Tax=Cylindrobasidium torrendii FP15055 ss-10 TaxID=1314674 RepID=A0A0D7AT33_9AGAR|nr:hypothetical protein CYLTODRAFT_415370 [Cylindrobasidium torrendii FP15055 ss-10]
MLFVVLLLTSLLAVHALSVRSSERETLSVEIRGSVVQCEALDVKVDGGTPPYTLSILPFMEVKSEPLVFELENDTTTAFFPSIPFLSGDFVVVIVKDSLGDSIDSGLVRVAPSDNSLCIRNSSPMSMGEILLRVLGSWIHAVRAQMGVL